MPITNICQSWSICIDSEQMIYNWITSSVDKVLAWRSEVVVWGLGSIPSENNVFVLDSSDSSENLSWIIVFCQLQTSCATYGLFR
jgi:hypothetical protein